MANHEEVETRIEMLLSLKAQGYRYSQLIQVAIQQWGICARQAKRYLKEVKNREKALVDIPIKERFGSILNKNQNLQSRVLHEGNLELYRKLLCDEAQMTVTYNKMIGKTNETSMEGSPQSHPAELEELFSKLTKDPLDS